MSKNEENILIKSLTNSYWYGKVIYAYTQNFRMDNKSVTIIMKKRGKMI